MTTGDRGELRKERVYAQPRELVWAALTDGQALAQWLMPNDFKPELGHEFCFHVDPMPMLPGNVVRCKVLVFEPMQRMVWSWRMVSTKPGKSLPAQEIEWVLMPHEGGGTRLILTQRGAGAMPWLYRLMMSMGWGTMMKRWLPKVMEGFERSGGGGYFYRRLIKAPNRGHHGVKTVPEGYFK